MTDEEQLGALLTIATALPDDVQPPVSQLLSKGRRRHRLRTGSAIAAVAAVAVLAAGLPLIIRSLEAPHSVAGVGQSPGPTRRLSVPAKPGSSNPGSPSPGPNPGPTPAELFRYHWARLRPSPLGPRQPGVLTWAGNDLLEIGDAAGGRPSRTGAAFDPAAGRWHLIAPVPFDVDVASATSTWTGRQLFVTDGRFPGCLSYPATRTGSGRPAACLPHAGLYDPVSNQWTTTPLPRQMYQLASMTATWTGRSVILAGVTMREPKLEVAAYDPATGRWTMITPALAAGHSPGNVAVVATGSRVIMWVTWSHIMLKPHPRFRVGTDVLALGGDGGWLDVTGSWPQQRTAPAPVFTGAEILIPTSENRCVTPSCPVSPIYPGAFANPVTLHRTLIPFSPIDAVQPPYIAAGQEIIEMNTNGGELADGRHIRQDETVAFDPIAGWRHLPAPPGRPKLAATPVWTGFALLALTTKGDLFALGS